MDRCIQIDSVSHRDEERLASLARPESRTQHVLVLMEKMGTGAFFLSPVFADQPGFGAANGGTIQKQSHMTGETKFSWMSQPLTVEKN